MYQLKRAGYDDCISIEFEGMEPVVEALRIGLANLKKLLGLSSDFGAIPSRTARCGTFSCKRRAFVV
jgi:hypothetical protein